MTQVSAAHLPEIEPVPTGLGSDTDDLQINSVALMVQLRQAELPAGAQPLIETVEMRPPRLPGLLLAALQRQGYGVYFKASASEDIPSSLTPYSAPEHHSAFMGLLERIGSNRDDDLHRFMERMLNGQLHEHPLEHEPWSTKAVSVDLGRQTLTPDNALRRGVMTSILVNHFRRSSQARLASPEWLTRFNQGQIREYTTRREAGQRPFTIRELLLMAGTVLDSHLREVPDFSTPQPRGD